MVTSVDEKFMVFCGTGFAKFVNECTTEPEAELKAAVIHFRARSGSCGSELVNKKLLEDAFRPEKQISRHPTCQANPRSFA